MAGLSNFPGNRYAKTICNGLSIKDEEILAQVYELRIGNLLALSRERRAAGLDDLANESRMQAEKMMGQE